ncbi:MAG TPA: family 1 glycosylhydrolase [Thermoleophilaceae bacterium]|nr:family 1 glycosylhydrolase [Thermoleophilaceae bacterium]
MRSRPLISLLVALAAVLLVPAQASAGARMETSIMDDQLLLNASPAALESDMALFKRLGVDRLRVSAFWNQVSPTPDARTKPAGFDLRDHTSGLYNFAELDRVVDSAVRNGLRVMISISTPAPVWASADPSRGNQLWKPRADLFGEFTDAVVRRYADRVDHWGISNEPNQGVWLQPQSDRSGLVAPHLYRSLVMAAYPRIKALDPTSTALVGELAASGRSGRGATRPIRPLLFLREMACRDSRWRPIRRGRCKNFKPIPADALGHHPYNLLQRPTNASPNKYDAAIGDGRRLTRTLDRLVRLRALQPGRGRRLSVFYTEFGYQTTPPDPFAGVSLNQQRLYLQQAAFIAQRTPRVRGLNQFRLTDGAIAGKGLRRFQEFQSGLMFRNRKPKPAYSVFAHPFVISGDRFWGQVRPGTGHTVRVQRKPTARGSWRLVAQVPTDRLGYFTFRLRGRKPGYYRYLYEGGKRSGTVRVRR